MKRLVYILPLILFSHLPFLSAETLDAWPRHVKMDSGIMTVYQPQIDGLDGDIITGRAAVAFKASKESEPVFGAVWLKGTITINREANEVRYRELEVTDTRFPEGSEEAGVAFTAAIKEGMKTWELDTTVEAVKTSLAASQVERNAQKNFKNTPPDIIYRENPTLLINIDGKTRLKDIEGSPYQNVENTPYPLFYVPKSRIYYLNVAEKAWYQAKSEDGPWSFDPKPPADLVQMVESRKPEQDKSDSTEKVTADNAPEIVVAHKPAELVVTEGEADFSPLSESLLVVKNSQTPIFMDVEGQQYYLNISGRWYHASSMTGEWQYIEASDLPSVFEDIPPDSSFADIRAYVAGTDEAREAVMDAQIPQTAAVQRGPVDITVIYDGNPKFIKVDGTNLTFAANASETVITDRKNYYLVKDGIWYISSKAQGPWEVSDHAPPGIAGVEPSSPVYNTKFVYVYASTPEVIYVGYTPGYVCNYVMGPTVVYGTGWVYDPWYGPNYYYPRHSTWGFAVRYNPVTGWGFGMSWSSGIFRFSWYSGGYWHRHPWYGAGMWGPARYRPSAAVINRGDINLNIDRTNIQNNLNIYNRQDQRAHIKDNWPSRPVNPDRPNNRPDNLPNRPDNSLPGNRPNRPDNTLPGDLPSNLPNRPDNSLPTNRPTTLPAERPDRGNLGDNNVFTDHEGNIFQNNDGNWKQQVNGKWQEAPNLNRPESRPEINRPSIPENRPQQRPANLPSTVTRPQMQTTRPRPSGYSSGNAMQRQSHARARSGGGGGGRRR